LRKCLEKLPARLREAVGHLSTLADLVHIYAVDNPRAIAAGRADDVRATNNKARRFLNRLGLK